MYWKFIAGITLTLIAAIAPIDTNAESNSKISLSVESVNLQGIKFSGQWVELWQNGNIIQENFTPFSALVDNGTQYQVYVYDDPAENKFFDHWDDGTTSQFRTINASSNVTLQAFFNSTSVNGAPGGVNDYVLVQKNQPVAIDVLANDVDPDFDQLYVTSIVVPPQNGTATINQNGTISYLAQTNFVGRDSFDYKISDGRGATDVAGVSITVNGTSNPISLASLVVRSVDQSNAEFSGQWVELWQNGNIIQENFTPFSTMVNVGSKYLVYIYDDPAENKFFTHWDDSNTSRTKEIDLQQNSTITAVFGAVQQNAMPIAINDTITTNEDTPVLANVLGNDSDQDGDPLLVVSASGASRGILSVNSNGTISYTPNLNTSGLDSFNYTISDGKGGTDTGIVFVTINPINDPPSAADDSGVYANHGVTIDALGNDSDPDGGTLRILQVFSPSNGTATLNPDDTITYIPNQSIADSDTFNYTITDGNLTSHATISLTRMHLDKLVSGLVAFDPLNNVTLTKGQLKNDTRYWHYNGSAISLFEPDAPYDFFQNSTGRYVGVQTPTDGAYAGFFGVAPPSQAALFHGVITTPIKTTANNFFQNGLYVQTADGRINYVTCVSITGTAGTTWHIVRTFGNTTQATQFEVLWSDTKPNQPSTRDCTIITNGVNYLKVYLDGTKIYENHSIDMQMPGPFLYFIEPQSSDSTKMLYGIYKDFYETKGELLTATNLPSDAKRAELVGSNGTMISSNLVNATTRTANIDIGALHFPISGKLRIVDSNGTEIITTGTQNFWGGDIYGITYPSVWKPEIGTSWNVQLRDPISDSEGLDVYAIDLFDNDKGVVDSIHANGTKAICYVNTGSWEAWRSDAASFPDYVKGKDLPDFPGEKWLDIRQLDVIGPIMQKRLDLCKEKGFDGVDPDNVESYKQDTGFLITYRDQMHYNTWLADEAHKRGLSIGLKNDLGQIGDLTAIFDWGTNEQCAKFNECNYLKPFIAMNKPVFHIEYLESGQTTDKFCPDSLSNKFDGILKSINLTAWYEPCKISNATSILRVLTELTNGTSAKGFFVSVNYNNTVKTGFTPTAMVVPSGHTITIQLSNFGSFVFDHWKDNNQTSSKRNVFLIDDSNLVAVYRNSNGN